MIDNTECLSNHRFNMWAAHTPTWIATADLPFANSCQRMSEGLPGELAGPGQSVSVPASETSNRWAGRRYAAYIPPNPADTTAHATRITDERVVGDPGPYNAWEPECRLNVIPDKFRPPYDPSGQSRRDLERIRRQLGLSSAPAAVTSRIGLFELELGGVDAEDGGGKADEKEEGGEPELPAEPLALLQRMEEGRVGEDVGLQELARRGWSHNVLRRYLKSARQCAAAGVRDGYGPVVSGGVLRGSGRHRTRVPTPGHVTSIGFLREVLETGPVGLDGVCGRSQACFPVLCGGLEGRIYRFMVRLAPSRGAGGGPGAYGSQGLKPPDVVLTRSVRMSGFRHVTQKSLGW